MSSGERFHDFKIGVTNDSPNDVTPAVDNYPLCYSHTGTLTNGPEFTADCTTPTAGRYVIIQVPGENEFLQICEVKVYAQGI